MKTPKKRLTKKEQEIINCDVLEKIEVNCGFDPTIVEIINELTAILHSLKISNIDLEKTLFDWNEYNLWVSYFRPPTVEEKQNRKDIILQKNIIEEAEKVLYETLKKKYS